MKDDSNILYRINHNKHFKQRTAKGGAFGKNTVWAALGVLILFLFLFFTPAGTRILSNTPAGSVVGNAIVTTSSLGNNLCSVSLTLNPTEIDALGGSGFNAPTGILYQATGPPVKLESPSFSSSGTATTGGKYTTGSPLAWQFSGASQYTEYVGGQNNIPFIVPPLSCGSNASTNAFNVYGITLQSYSITVQGQGGTTLFNKGTSYFSQFPGGSSGIETVTVLLSGNNANQGVKASYDFIDGLWMNFIIELKDTGSSLSISQMPRLYQYGGATTRTWPIVCPDGLTGTGFGTAGGSGALTAIGSGTQQSEGSYDTGCSGSLSQQTVGATVYGAQGAAFSFGVAKGSLASGSTETLTLTMYKYADYNWYAVNGVYGPSTGNSQAATVGSTWTQVFNNG